MQKRHYIVAGLACLLGAAALARAEEPLPVAVTIVPQAAFVERVGGPHVAVQVLVRPGQSPHAYEPSPRELTEVSKARLYFAIGIDAERGTLPRLQRMFPDMKVVDMTAGVPRRPFSAAEADHEEEHGPAHEGEREHEHEHEHAAGRPDPHIWLSPTLAKIQAQTVCDALCQADAAHADEYRRNLAAFHAELDQVHDELAAALAPFKGRQVFVFHPAFGYFCDEFGLQQVSIEIAGKTPSARQLAEVIERARALHARVIFVQPQFSSKAAEAVARAIGGSVVPLDDLARDYFANLRDMAGKIRAALGAEPAPASAPATKADHP